jgi:hypothetical protein
VGAGAKPALKFLAPSELKLRPAELYARKEGGAELGGGRVDITLPVLAGEHRAVTLTPVGCRRGEPR